MVGTHVAGEERSDVYVCYKDTKEKHPVNQMAYKVHFLGMQASQIRKIIMPHPKEKYKLRGNQYDFLLVNSLFS